MKYWLMSVDAATELQERIKLVKAGGLDPDIGSSRPIVSEQDGVNVLRIHGPIFARDDLMTKMLMTHSTEEYMETFESLVSKGEPILLDVDSLGGEPGLIFEFAELIHQAGEQVSSYSGNTAASAAFLLHQAAAGNRFAHEAASLGSVGVVAVIHRLGDEEIQILSANAENKRGESGLQSHVNQIENKFHTYLENFTGMTRDKVVENSEKGGLFMGSAALDKGFLTANTNFKGAIAQINSSESAFTYTENASMSKFTQAELDAAVEAALKAATPNSLITQADVDAQVSAAVQESNDRYAKLSAHTNGSNVAAVARLARSSMSIEEALEHMDDVVPAIVVAPVSASASSESAAELEARMKKAANEAAAAAIDRIRAEASDVSALETAGGSNSDLTGGEDAATLEKARIAAANERRSGVNS